MRKIFVSLLIGAFALAACGTPATGGVANTPAASPAPAATAAPTAAPETTAAPSPVGPKPGGGGTSVRPPDALVQAAQQQLAAFLKRPAAQIELQSANKQEWPDGALGCPEDGMAYPQMVTEGFLLVFTADNQAQRYEVHTGATAAQMLLCADSKPTNLVAIGGGAAPSAANPPALDDRGQGMLALARATLAKELGVDENSVQMVSGEPVEWNDSALGCTQAGQVAMQVITPGYRFTLEAGGQSYEVHTDAGKRVVRCDGK